MKWHNEWFKGGDERIRRIFLWFPYTEFHEGRIAETRWLEFANIKERYNRWIPEQWEFIGFAEEK